MSDMEQKINERFTELSYRTKSRLENFFHHLHSWEEVMELIEEFQTLPPDGKGDVERRIVEILVNCNELTEYVKKYDSKPLCSDKTDNKSVEEAANQYRECALYLQKADTFDELFYEKLLEVYHHYKSSSDYMARLVKKRMQVLSPELIQEHDTTRVLILKQFLKVAEFPNTNCFSRALRDYVYEITGLSKKATSSEILAAIATISDDFFSKLNELPTTGKDAKKSFKEKWEPLFWAKDIAEGIFNDQQTTRSKLYWFAIIFDMSYYSGLSDERLEEDSDIQKNLFYDYYADNLLNNLLSEDSAIEKEPTGHGINFKNFAEVIYLYYIHRKDLSPKQKLIEANRMIQLCKSEDEVLLNSQTEKHHSKDTMFYEPLASRAMRVPQEDLHRFIVDHYICGKKGVHVIRTESGNRTAASVYKSLVQKMKIVAESISDHADISYEHVYSIMEREYYKVKCSKCKDAVKGTVYTDCPFYKTKCYHAYSNYRMTKLSPIEDRDNIKRIKNRIVQDNVSTILLEAGRFVGTWSKENINSNEYDFFETILNKLQDKFGVVDKPTLEESIDSTFMPKEDVEHYVTRTKMIIVYYYIFVLYGLCEESECHSFRHFYDDFCDNFELVLETVDKNGNRTDRTYYGINECLIESGYQEINPKNIFDIIIIYFAFKNHKKFRYMDFENGGEYNDCL